MIFVTDAAGQCIHVSEEWTALTGQPTDEALGRRWLDRVHPKDRAIVADTIDEAIVSAAEFSVRYRLLDPDDAPRWVGGGGLPSFGVPDNIFIGYLGSITELAEGATNVIAAYGNVERFIPPAAHPATLPGDHLDLIADHLILVHALIEDDGVKAALPSVKMALFEVGVALAARTRRRPRLN